MTLFFAFYQKSFSNNKDELIEDLRLAGERFWIANAI